MSKVQDIAKEITLKAIENNIICVNETRDNEQNNSSYAKEISKFYKTVYKTVKDTDPDLSPK